MLPPELWDRVLGFLSSGGSDETSTLQACSLVNNVFCAISQRALFAELRLSTSEVVPQILEQLEQSPHLAGLVHGLELTREAFRASASIAQILPMFPCIHQLSIVGYGVDDEDDQGSPPRQWTGIPSDIMHALEKHTFTNLTSLSLTYLENIPVDWVLRIACPRLETLYLANFDRIADIAVTNGPATESSVHPLMEFRIDVCPATSIPTVARALRSSGCKLQSLHLESYIRPAIGTVDGQELLLRDYGHGLRSLALGFWGYYYTGLGQSLMSINKLETGTLLLMYPKPWSLFYSPHQSHTTSRTSPIL